MSTYLNLACADTANNTGFIGCAVNPALLNVGILAPKGTRLTLANLASLKTVLQGLTLVSKTTRIYPLEKFEGLTDNSEDVTFQSLGFGSKRLNREGKYDWTYMMVAGQAYNNKLRMFNGLSKYGVYLVDSEYNFYGTESYNSGTSQMECAPFSLDYFYAYPFTAADGSKPVEYKVRFGFADTKELNEKSFITKLDFDVYDNVKGLIDFTVAAGTTSAIHDVAYVKLAITENGESMAVNYATEFADKAAWLIDGVAGTATGVTYNATTDEFAIAFTSTGTHIFSTVIPATLAGLGIGGAPEVGYECTNSVSIAVPTS